MGGASARSRQASSPSFSLLVTGIIAARALGVHNRGYLAAFVLKPVVITLIGSLGIASAVPYFVARRPLERARVIRVVVPITAVQLVVLTAGHAVVGGAVLPAASAEENAAWLASMLFVPGMLMNQLGLAIMQGDQQFEILNVARLAPSILNAVTVAALWSIGAASLVALTASLSILTLLGGIAALLVSNPGWQPAMSTGPTLRDLTSFGLRGFLGSTSPSETFRLDQVIVAALLPTASLGLYVTASAFTNLVRLVAQSIGMVAYPAIASVRDAAGGMRLVWRHTIGAAALTGGIAMVLVPTMPWLLPLLFGDPFAAAVLPAQILVLGSVFLGIRRVLGDALRGLGLPGPSSMAEIASWAGFLGLVPVLAERAGIVGVALALAISWAGSLGALLIGHRLRSPKRLRADAAI